MAAIVTAADESETVALDNEFLNQTFARVDQSIAYGALFTAYHLRCKAIVAMTQSGSTALWMSRHDIDIPIYALTPRLPTQRKLSLFRNVIALETAENFDRDTALIEAVQLLLRKNVVASGDLIVITIGEPMGQAGGTNTLKIVKVGELMAQSSAADAERTRGGGGVRMSGTDRS